MCTARSIPYLEESSADISSLDSCIHHSSQTVWQYYVIQLTSENCSLRKSERSRTRAHAINPRNKEYRITTVFFSHAVKISNLRSLCYFQECILDRVHREPQVHNFPALYTKLAVNVRSSGALGEPPRWSVHHSVMPS